MERVQVRTVSDWQQHEEDTGLLPTRGFFSQVHSPVVGEPSVEQGCCRCVAVLMETQHREPVHLIFLRGDKLSSPASGWGRGSRFLSWTCDMLHQFDSLPRESELWLLWYGTCHFHYRDHINLHFLQHKTGSSNQIH